MRRRIAALFVAGLLGLPRGAMAQGYSVVQSGSAAPSPSTPAATTTPSGSTDVTPADTTAEPTRRHRARIRSGDSGVEVAGDHRPWDYGGVAPGNANTPPGLGRRAQHSAHPIIVAWPGFQMTPSGSRFFLGVTASPTVTTEHARNGEVIVRIHNARVPVRNNRRPLITDAFDTPVERAYLRQHGSDVDVVIVLRAPGDPQISQQTNAQGLSYVFVDFARWTPPNHIPQVFRERNGEGIRPSTDANAPPVQDEETPPPVEHGP